MPKGSGWIKLNKSPVCFGAKGDQFGRFKYDRNIFVRSIMFVHRSGTVTCSSSIGYSYWGCAPNRPNEIATMLTDENNKILAPSKEGASLMAGTPLCPGKQRTSPVVLGRLKKLARGRQRRQNVCWCLCFAGLRQHQLSAHCAPTKNSIIKLVKMYVLETYICIFVVIWFLAIKQGQESRDYSMPYNWFSWNQSIIPTRNNFGGYICSWRQWCRVMLVDKNI